MTRVYFTRLVPTRSEDTKDEVVTTVDELTAMVTGSTDCSDFSSRTAA